MGGSQQGFRPWAERSKMRAYTFYSDFSKLNRSLDFRRRAEFLTIVDHYYSEVPAPIICPHIYEPSNSKKLIIVRGGFTPVNNAKISPLVSCEKNSLISPLMTGIPTIPIPDS